MPFSIDRVIPWGRTLAEYRAMFDLSEGDLGGRILGCGDGPASFNAEMSAQGRVVVSVDPLYSYSAAAIERRVQETFDVVMKQARDNQQDFVWTHVPSIQELGRRRMSAMRRFLSDFPTGKIEGRILGCIAAPFALYRQQVRSGVILAFSISIQRAVRSVLSLQFSARNAQGSLRGTCLPPAAGWRCSLASRSGSDGVLQVKRVSGLHRNGFLRVSEGWEQDDAATEATSEKMTPEITSATCRQSSPTNACRTLPRDANSTPAIVPASVAYSAKLRNIEIQRF